MILLFVSSARSARSAHTYAQRRRVPVCCTLLLWTWLSKPFLLQSFHASFSFLLVALHFHLIFLSIYYLVKRNWNSPRFFFMCVAVEIFCRTVRLSSYPSYNERLCQIYYSVFSIFTILMDILDLEMIFSWVLLLTWITHIPNVHRRIWALFSHCIYV